MLDELVVKIRPVIDQSAVSRLKKSVGSVSLGGDEGGASGPGGNIRRVLKGMEGITAGIGAVALKAGAIVGEHLGKVLDVLTQASPHLKGVLRILQNSLNMFLMPIGQVIATTLMPMSVYMAQMSALFVRLFHQNGFWSAFGDVLGRMGGDLVNSITSGWAGIMKDTPLWDGLTNLHALLENIYNYTASALQPVVEGISSALGGLADWLGSMLPDMGRAIGAVFSASVDSAREGLRALESSVTSGLASAVEWLRAIPDRIGGAVSSAIGSIQSAVEGVTSGVSRLYDMLRGVLKPIADSLGGVVQAVSDPVGSVTGAIKDTLGGIGGFLGGLIPFARGGVVTGPTPALIGEAGPEAVIPIDRLFAQMDELYGERSQPKSESIKVEVEAVIPRDAVGQSLTINFHAPIYGMQDFERQVRRIIGNTTAGGRFL